MTAKFTTEADQIALREMVHDGKSWREIGRHFNVTGATAKAAYERIGDTVDTDTVETDTVEVDEFDDSRAEYDAQHEGDEVEILTTLVGINGPDVTIVATADGAVEAIVEEPPADKPAKTRKSAKADRAPKDEAPEGMAFPVAFFHLLVDKGLAEPGLTTQLVYSWLKAKRNPIPTAQVGTRTAIKVDEGLAWYQARRAAKAAK